MQPRPMPTDVGTPSGIQDPTAPREHTALEGRPSKRRRPRFTGCGNGTKLESMDRESSRGAVNEPRTGLWILRNPEWTWSSGLPKTDVTPLRFTKRGHSRVCEKGGGDPVRTRPGAEPGHGNLRSRRPLQGRRRAGAGPVRKSPEAVRLLREAGAPYFHGRTPKTRRKP